MCLESNASDETFVAGITLLTRDFLCLLNSFLVRQSYMGDLELFRLEHFAAPSDSAKHGHVGNDDREGQGEVLTG